MAEAPAPSLIDTVKSRFSTYMQDPEVQQRVTRAKDNFNRAFPGLIPAKPTTPAVTTPTPAAATPAAPATAPPAKAPEYDWVKNFNPGVTSVTGIYNLAQAPATVEAARMAGVTPQEYVDKQLPAVLAARRQAITQIADPAARREADLQLRAAELSYLRTGTEGVKNYSRGIDHAGYNKAMAYTPEELAALPGNVASRITGLSNSNPVTAITNKVVGSILTNATDLAAKGEADKAVTGLQQIAATKPVESGFADWASKWAPAIALGVGGLLMMFGNTPARLVGALAMLGGGASAVARVRNLTLPESRTAISEVLSNPQLLQDDATLKKTYSPQQYAAIKDFQFAASFEWGKQFLEKQLQWQAADWQKGYWPTAPNAQNVPQ